jgi:uncharacterized DUF497 family protein
MPTVVEGDFEWDSTKAESNLAKHGVSFPEVPRCSRILWRSTSTTAPAEATWW